MATKSETYLAKGVLYLSDELDALRAENERLREALEVYADKDNWSTEARAEVLTGEVRADGWELAKEVSLILDDDWVFVYDDTPGWLVAQDALKVNES